MEAMMDINEYILSQQTRAAMVSKMQRRFPNLDNDLIEDGIQEGIIKAITYLHDHPDYTLRTTEDADRWLTRICHNAILSEYRRDAAWRRVPARARRQLRYKGDDGWDDVDPTPGVITFSDVYDDWSDDTIDTMIPQDTQPPTHDDPRIPLLAVMDRECLQAALTFIIRTGRAWGWEAYVERMLGRGKGYAKQQKEKVKAAKDLYMPVLRGTAR